MNTEKDSVCQCCCPIFCFTHTSTGTLSSRGNTAPSSFKSIRRDSRRSMMVKAVRNKADRPESKRAEEQDWRNGNITNVFKKRKNKLTKNNILSTLKLDKL